MPDSWDWVEEELKKIQDDMPVDPEMMQVVDAISVADFWKRRYDEEQMLWERKLNIKEEEKKSLEEHAGSHETAIKELSWKLKELERRWEQEKLLLEDRLKAKDVETSLEKEKMQWETRLEILENENKNLKTNIGASHGIHLTPEMARSGAAVAQVTGTVDEKTLQRLSELEEEKSVIEKTLKEKEETLSTEKVKWASLEKESSQMSSLMTKRLSGLKEREEEHFIMLEDLARGFAHRVRNYLGIMSGTIQLCVSSYKMDKELEDQLNVVDQNVQDMLGSIEDFLKFARIPEMSIKKLDLNNVIETVLIKNDTKFKAQKVKINREYGQNLPAFDGDQAQLEEGFAHLFDNAVEAMPTGGQITVTTTFDNVMDIITIKITDTGIGISEGHIKKIFQPYFSTKKGRKGISLTSSKRVFNLHKGTLNIESVKDKGATAVINLFIEPPQEAKK